MSRKAWEKKPDRMSLRRQRKFGATRHNADMQQSVRFLNAQAKQDKETKDSHKGQMYGSVKELMRAKRKRR